MNNLIIIGVIWILISVFNYMKFIPDDQKKKTGFIAFIGFAIISPFVTLFVYGMHYINKVINL